MLIYAAFRILSGYSAANRWQCSSGVMISKGLLSRSMAKMMLQILCMTAPIATGFFLQEHLPGVVVVNYRIHRCAASFSNLYVIERGHMKNPSGKAGATLGHMYFIAIELSGLFDSGVKPKVGVKLFRGRKSLKSPISATRTTALKNPIPYRDCRRQIWS